MKCCCCSSQEELPEGRLICAICEEKSRNYSYSDSPSNNDDVSVHRQARISIVGRTANSINLAARRIVEAIRSIGRKN